ncbi:glycosyltransferase family A protein [Massilia sp. 9I]|uniref:glycosyltransferase family A protein n=1 Tax=Massilia sp. 9I TaxID=2653152 RepID=UPI0012F0F2A9|nr:glycosyltransferase family 2 protein [Massilia sp. 9I]VXC21146.1 Glycosyltransferase involved in cell wall bisynthesis [Massilia sp. 9I]
MTTPPTIRPRAPLVSQATFSVIIPTYNNALTLARSLDSVLAQTYPAHEIFVVDDGSMDGTREVVAAYGDRVIYHYQPNAGVSVARNVGARMATGSWLAFLDADDTFAPDRLALHAEWIERDPDLDFLLGDQDFLKPDGSFTHAAITSSAFGRALQKRHPNAHEIVLEEDDFGPLIADGFAEIRTLSLSRATFHRLGGFPVGTRIGEDLQLIVRLCAASRRAGVVMRTLAHYYIYPSSAIRKDALGSQRAFVATLEELAGQMNASQPGLRSGLREKIRQARLSLAYMYLRQRLRRAAIGSVLPMLRPVPSLTAIRDVLSVVRGIR